MNVLFSFLLFEFSDIGINNCFDLLTKFFLFFAADRGYIMSSMNNTMHNMNYVNPVSNMNDMNNMSSRNYMSNMNYVNYMNNMNSGNTVNSMNSGSCMGSKLKTMGRKPRASRKQKASSLKNMSQDYLYRLSKSNNPMNGKY
jgi:hypothetical protein